MVEKNTSNPQEIKKKPVPAKKIKPSLDDDEDDEEESDLVDSDEDDESIERIEGSSKVKYLPPSVIKDIEQKNVARKLAGLPPILTRIRHCLTCGAKFQSAGNRTCGCASRVAGIIAGREII